MIKNFKFLQIDKEPNFRFFTFTNLYNRVDVVQLPWGEYSNHTNEPKRFEGTFNQFRAHYLINNFLPTIFEIELRRGGWFATHYSLSRPLDRRILKNDKLIILYDTVQIF